MEGRKTEDVNDDVILL